jgi:flagellar hook-basal body complex protein FliE
MSMEFGLKSVTGAGGSNQIREMREALQSDRAAGSQEGKGASFGDFLKSLAEEANTSQLVADGKMQEVAAGRNKDLHGAVLAMEKADVNFRLLSQVRNKVIEAYREIMRMQV